MENFQEDLTKFLIKLKGVVSVGTPWWGFDIKSKPTGVQLYQGQILSRDAYPVHFSWIQTHKTIVTDQEWLEYSEAHNGFCPYFSYGDNVNTYRMPKIVDVHPKFVYWGDDVGSYVEPGLPNITGTWEMNGLTDNAYVGVATGAFDIYTTTQPNNADGFSAGNPRGISFNANKCSSIYGASDTVQPPSINMVMGEYVISSVGDFSSTTEETIQANIETLELELSKYLSESELNAILNKYNTSYVKESWHDGSSWYRIWSDGWIEQGGYFGAVNAAWTSYTVTFPKSFTTNLYTALCAVGHTTNTDNGCISVKTSTTCTFARIYNSTGLANWYVCGY
mgnify:CR=1 FL=1